jgi:hypothetical protein
VPDAPQISLADGLNGAGQYDVRFKMEIQFFKNFGQGRDYAHAERIVQNSGPGDGIFFDGIIYRLIFFIKCIQMGMDKNGRPAGVGTPEDTHRVPIPIGGDFVDLEFGQPFHEKLAALFFSKCRRSGLTDQYDVGNNDLLERFYLIDQAGQFFEKLIHAAPSAVIIDEWTLWGKSVKADISEIRQSILNYTKIEYKVNLSKNLFRCAYNWNDGKMEYWKIGSQCCIALKNIMIHEINQPWIEKTSTE